MNVHPQGSSSLRSLLEPDTYWYWAGDDIHEHCSHRGKDFTIPFYVVLESALQKCRFIAMDHNVLAGIPRIKGTRIPVYMIVDAVQFYGNLEGASISYPELTPEQIKDALLFAGIVMEHPVEYESQASSR